jgi:hypothetical protein
MEKHDALGKLKELEALFYSLAGARKALEISIDLDSNRAAIEKEHKDALNALLSEKKNLVDMKEKVSKAEEELKAKLNENKLIVSKNDAEINKKTNEEKQKYAAFKEKLEAAYEKDKADYDAMIKEKSDTLKELETKIENGISKLNNLRESAKSWQCLIS